MKDLNQRFCQPMKLSDIIKDFVTEKYEVPIHEVPIWIENGWKYDEIQNRMHRKGRESVKVQLLKANKL